MIETGQTPDPAAMAQAIIQTIPDVIYIFNLADQRLVYTNRQVTDLLGYSAEDVARFGSGMELFGSVVHPDDLSLVVNYLTRWEFAKDGDVLESRYRSRHQDGSWRWIHGRDTVFQRSSDGTVSQILGTMRDITAERLAAEQNARVEDNSRQKQKIEALGMLAAGVAHEINNPMTIVSGYARQLAEQLPDDSPQKRQAVDMTKACDRITSITRKLLAFARREDGQRHEAVVSELVDDTLSLIVATLRHDKIQLEVNLAPEPLAITCIPQQVQQVVMNLVTNARDSLKALAGPDQRVIRISSTLLKDDGRRFARLTVEDNGPGIKGDVMPKIFDPFFTTKPQSAGTGLGLSISHGIVTGHGGRISAESTAGVKTSFHIDFPLSEASPP